MGCEAVVLRSRYAQSCRRVALPESVRIPIGRRIHGVFLLHAGGWLHFHQPVAEYRFGIAGREEAKVEVVAYGASDSSADGETDRVERSIIQDWHPSFPSFTSANAMPYFVTENGDPFLYLRHLYLYYWSNPYPELPVEHFTMRTYHPHGEATLGLLAMTLADKRS
ncbi:MAG: hypothetical protein HC888_01235 [Candidatus Competibacteraceae bacterium]|nr:hypothetical protein [Candidatus Competibacteraceae bacterium]